MLVLVLVLVLVIVLVLVFVLQRFLLAVLIYRLLFSGLK
jgi:hypothetical protein